MSESETELDSCPDCEAKLTASGAEFVGEGVMFRNIGCTNCDWSAVEEWQIESTESQ